MDEYTEEERLKWEKGERRANNMFRVFLWEMFILFCLLIIYVFFDGQNTVRVLLGLE